MESTHTAEADRLDRPSNFIREIVDQDLAAGMYDRVVTRFPPEPNGYLHIGHAKSICLNFGLAEDYRGVCHLRFDDTNPTTEDVEYVESIMQDVRWLGFDWGDHLYHASDYFDRLYDFALQLIQSGVAYVDSQSEEEIRGQRGTVTEPGTESPFRTRSVEENLDLFERMRAGDFADGTHVLRARIDMASPNMKMRDPLLYRIRHAHHYRTGDRWCIYPMYDFAHPLSDAIENITHSLCTLEFDNNRELYDWLLDHSVTSPRPHQYEFSRLNLDYTVMSKRKLLRLVQEGHVDGWDDPRMPTIAAIRRRGVTPEALREFSERVGVTKTEGRVDIGLLEHTLRDDLNHRAPRVMAVLRPLKVVITNYPEGETEWLDAPYWPHDVPREGSRRVPFSRELYIERDDFLEVPTRKFYRLAPGREVRLRYAFFITCDEVVKDQYGDVVELRCTYDPETRGGDAPDGRRVKGTLHWVSADHALSAEVRLYDRLFTAADPEEGSEDLLASLNPLSLVVLKDCRLEPSIADDASDIRYQFERQGYFWQDPIDSAPTGLVFNRIVALRESWTKIAEGAGEETPAAASRSPQPAPADRPATHKAEPREERDPVESLKADARDRFRRYTRDLGLQLDDALILAGSPEIADFFEDALSAHTNAKGIANWVINELLREIKETPLDALPFGGRQIGSLIALIDDGTISSRLAKDVFDEMIQSGGEPDAIIERKGLRQLADRDALAPIVSRVVESNPEKAAQYREGKAGLIGFFIGQVMRETSGRANPELAREMVLEILEG